MVNKQLTWWIAKTFLIRIAMKQHFQCLSSGPTVGTGRAVVTWGSKAVRGSKNRPGPWPEHCPAGSCCCLRRGWCVYDGHFSCEGRKPLQKIFHPMLHHLTPLKGVRSSQVLLFQISGQHFPFYLFIFFPFPGKDAAQSFSLQAVIFFARIAEKSCASFAYAKESLIRCSPGAGTGL